MIGRYCDVGFDLRRDERIAYHYDTLRLVEVTVAQMRSEKSGGVSCEPGDIFFACNNHPHVALTMLRSIGRGDWSEDTRKWEEWALCEF